MTPGNGVAGAGWCARRTRHRIASRAMDKTFALHVPDASLDPEPLGTGQIVAGAPEVSGRVLWRSADGTQDRGIWQSTPGSFTDAEVDELCVILSGRATSNRRTGPSWNWAPVTSCLLREGEHTRWTVHETLRKVCTTTGG